MEQSILKSTKKILGTSPDDTSFDLDIMTHINNAFSVLHDLGVGPVEGFIVEDEAPEWADFLADDKVKLSKVKTCVFLRVRLVFDPPASAYLQTALENQLREAEWRLNVNRENEDWVDPDPVVDPNEELVVTPPVLDGGDL